MKEQVRERIRDEQDRLLAFLEELVEAQSISGEEQPGQEVVLDRFNRLDLDIDTWEPSVENLKDHPGFFETVTYSKYGYEGRKNIVGTKEGAGNGRSLVFSGHIDVVTPEPVSAWTYDPWEPTIENGRMYGRGTMDMKGGIAAFIHAFEMLEELGVRLEGDLLLQTTIEEEAGGVGGVLSALKRGYQPDAAIIPEPFGIPNIGIAGAGVSYFRVRVPGKAAHTARKYRGVNAIGKAMIIYRALEKLDQERRQRISYKPAVNQDPKAEGSVTNLSVSVMEAGDWVSKVPGEAVLTGRIGWPPGEHREDVRNEVTKTIQEVARSDPWLSDNEPDIKWFGWDAEPHEVDTDEEIIRLARRNAEAVTGGETAYVGGLGGVDERFYNLYHDIPAISLGPRGEGGHGPDEYVEIDSLVETSQILAMIAIEWCGITS